MEEEGSIIRLLWACSLARRALAGIWTLDYPYVKFDSCSADFLLNANIPQADKELIAHGNVEKLLGL